MRGELLLPRGKDCRGVVVFVHGSGSSGKSPRNRFVAELLVEGGYGALLMDLLEEGERGDPLMEEDFSLMARRVAEAVEEIREDPRLDSLPVALYGASSGAAIAILAAELLREGEVRTLISRGGRPDLAGEAQGRVRVPVLFIVGSEDPMVLALNQEACELVPGEHFLQVVEGASHLFQEPGTLEEAARLTLSWLDRHMSR